MGLIKEPYGVDFIIQSQPLTDQERTPNQEFQPFNRKKQMTLTFLSFGRKLHQVLY